MRRGHVDLDRRLCDASTRARGPKEIANHRMGRKKELDAIEVFRVYGDAQRAYHSEGCRADGVREYAQRFADIPRKDDGLSWEAKSVRCRASSTTSASSTGSNPDATWRKV